MAHRIIRYSCNNVSEPVAIYIYKHAKRRQTTAIAVLNDSVTLL